MPDYYTDDDLNKLEKEPHIHIYKECIGNPKGISGWVIRVFCCKECELYRTVFIKVGDEREGECARP